MANKEVTAVALDAQKDYIKYASYIADIFYWNKEHPEQHAMDLNIAQAMVGVREDLNMAYARAVYAYCYDELVALYNKGKCARAQFEAGCIEYIEKYDKHIADYEAEKAEDAANEAQQKEWDEREEAGEVDPGFGVNPETGENA